MYHCFLGYSGTDEPKLTPADAINGKHTTDSDVLRRKANDRKNN